VWFCTATIPWKLKDRNMLSKISFIRTMKTLKVWCLQNFSSPLSSPSRFSFNTCQFLLALQKYSCIVDWQLTEPHERITQRYWKCTCLSPNHIAWPYMRWISQLLVVVCDHKSP
jgi:hypothetical protein